MEEQYYLVRYKWRSRHGQDEWVTGTELIKGTPEPFWQKKNYTERNQREYKDFSYNSITKKQYDDFKIKLTTDDK